MGNCASLSSDKQLKETGISSQSYHNGNNDELSNHTGHIGIVELRSGKVDPEKIKKEMAEIAATLNIDVANTIPIIDNDNDNIPITTTTISPSNQEPEITDRSVEEFKIKRKPALSTITSISAPSPPSPPSTNELIVDPMKKVFAALRMPSDGNFDVGE
nr:15291_t:CDS:2 [Entrophospora candida]